MCVVRTEGSKMDEELKLFVGISEVKILGIRGKGRFDIKFILEWV